MENVNDFSAEVMEKATRRAKYEKRNSRSIVFVGAFIVILLIGTHYFKFWLNLAASNLGLFVIGMFLIPVLIILLSALSPAKVSEEKVKEYADQFVKREKASLKESLREFKKNKEMVGLQEIELQSRLELLEDYEFSQEEAAVFGKKS